MTIRLVVLLLESAFVELLQAKGADKVLGVEFAKHSRDTTAGDRFMAAGTQRAAFCVIMRLAVRLAFVVEERTRVKRLPAVLEIDNRVIS